MYGSGTNTYEGLVDVCVSSAMTSLRSMTNDHLSDYLNDDAKLDELIDNLPMVRSLPNKREAGLAQNKSLAEWNLSQEPRITQLKAQLKESYDRAMQLKPEVEALKKKLDESSSGHSLETSSNLLQVAAHEVDDEAEELSRQFEGGTLSADLFLKQFVEKKALAHKRKIKSERLNALLRDQQHGTSSINTRPVSVNTPYPSYPNIGNQPPMPNVNRHSFW